jgi:hypothetical protein
MKETAKRGARFHPTVGVETPTGFTTSHPRDETTMSRDLRLSVCQCPGAKVAILPLCDHSLCVKTAEFPSRSPLSIVSVVRLILSQGRVWHDSPRV